MVRFCSTKSHSTAFLGVILTIMPAILCQQALALNNFASNEHTDPTELQAIYDVMVATGNAWASKIHDVCKGRWHGIECVADKEHVLHVISLSFGVLSDDTAFPVCAQNATISPSVAKLPHLKRLFFYQCCKANPQPIPSEIAKLGSSLEALVLRDNGHIGRIPKELSSLSKLKSLDLHGNNLSSAIPSELPNHGGLQLLDLSSNALQGEIPSAMGSLPSLRVLDLSNNILHGPIPSSLGNLTNIKKLDLSANQLTGAIPPALGLLKSAVLVDFSYNSALTGGIPPSFALLKELQVLIMGGTNLQGSIPPVLGSLPKLQALVLSNSGIVGTIPRSLGRLPKLQVLYLDRNRLRGEIPPEIARLPALSEFNVESNDLYGRIPFSTEVLIKLGQRIRLRNNSGLCYGASIATEAYLLPDSIGRCKQTRLTSHPVLTFSSNSAPKSHTAQLPTTPNRPFSTTISAALISSTTFCNCMIFYILILDPFR